MLIRYFTLVIVAIAICSVNLVFASLIPDFYPGWEAYQKQPEKVQVPLRSSASGNSYTDPTTGMEFVRVKGGCFQMGDTFGDGQDDEKPVHEVCVDDYSIGKTEVTVGQFRQFIDSSGYRTDAEKDDGCYVWKGSKWNKERDKSWRDPGFRQGDTHPVACVSWNDVSAYVDWLTEKSSKGVRLPTEAEWEYAARSGGKSEKWAGTSSESSLANFAWYSGNSGDQTHPVAQKKANGLGLYDMNGNVWEWVGDWYADDYYAKSPRKNPQGPGGGANRVDRGGSWYLGATYVRTANRSGDRPGNRYNNLGFRLVLP